MADYYDDTLDDLDTGIGALGPFLDWRPEDAKNDRTILAGTWTLRESGGGAVPFALTEFVFDWPISRTGWKEDTKGVRGVSPRKQWNASRKKFEQPPADGKWKRAMQVQVAVAPDQRALWEQSGFGAYISYVDIMRLIAATAPGELPKLPLLAFTGKRPLKTGSGPTLVGVFALTRYVPAPTCLVEARALLAPAATPAPALAAPTITMAVKPTSDAWAEPAASQREQINREVPISRWDTPAGGGDLDLGDDIPFGPEVR